MTLPKYLETYFETCKEVSEYLKKAEKGIHIGKSREDIKEIIRNAYRSIDLYKKSLGEESPLCGEDLINFLKGKVSELEEII